MKGTNCISLIFLLVLTIGCNQQNEAKHEKSMFSYTTPKIGILVPESKTWEVDVKNSRDEYYREVKTLVIKFSFSVVNLSDKWLDRYDIKREMFDEVAYGPDEIVQMDWWDQYGKSQSLEIKDNGIFNISGLNEDGMLRKGDSATAEIVFEIDANAIHRARGIDETNNLNVDVGRFASYGLNKKKIRRIFLDPIGL